MHHFPPFRADVSTATLWRGHERIPLSPKPFALLRCLLQHRGRVVSREGLLAAVWPDTHVHPANVKVLVGDVRRALADDPEHPTYIRSIPRRGYVFAAPVVEAPGELAGFGSGDPPPPGRERAFQVLAEALGDAQSARRRIVFAVGPPGSGKTALVERFLGHVARASSMRVTWAAAAPPQLSRFPVSPLPLALARLARAADSRMMAQCFARYAPSWLPFVESDVTAQPTEAALDPQPAIYGRQIRELISVIEAASVDLPLVVWLDDLHWADPLSLDVIARLSRRPEPARLLVICTLHAEAPLTRAPAFRRVMADLVTRRAATLLDLAPSPRRELYPRFLA
jgi:DNA-binding winged helix-turn-helix (wHTH) protein